MTAAPLPDDPTALVDVEIEIEVAGSDERPDGGAVNARDHFFNRQPDGTVRLRMRLSPEEASLIEEAAGDTPLMIYLHKVVNAAALRHRDKLRDARMRRMRRHSGR